MQYHGGKNRVAKHIARVILERKAGATTYVEPFLGAGSVAALVAPHFDRALLADASPDVIMLWHAIINAEPLPEHITEQRWRELMTAEPSAERALAGYGCSFGGRFFEGYARDQRKKQTFAQTAIAGLQRKAKGIAGADIALTDYRYISIPDNSLIYADPPYANTKHYKRSAGHFNSEEFWQYMEKHARNGAVVLVSEYQAPEGWEVVWSQDVPATINGGTRGTVQENLYTLNPNNY